MSLLRCKSHFFTTITENKQFPDRFLLLLAETKKIQTDTKTHMYNTQTKPRWKLLVHGYMVGTLDAAAAAASIPDTHAPKNHYKRKGLRRRQTFNRQAKNRKKKTFIFVLYCYCVQSFLTRGPPPVSSPAYGQMLRLRPRARGPFVIPPPCSLPCRQSAAS